MNQLLNVEKISPSKILRLSILLKKGRSHHIHALIRALGREDSRNEELEGALEIKFAMYIRVAPNENPINRASALHGLRICHHPSEITRQRAKGETLAGFLVKSTRDSR